jgi:hypothetical protein
MKAVMINNEKRKCQWRNNRENIGKMKSRAHRKYQLNSNGNNQYQNEISMSKING